MTNLATGLNLDSDVVMTHEVLHQLTDGVYIVDRDRRILFWNKAAEKITGYPAEEVTGSCCHDDILRHVDDEGRGLCQDGCPLSAAMEDGRPRQVHLHLSHRDGHRVPVHVRGTPIYGKDGSVIACVEVFNDDTQRLSMMDRLAQLQSQALLDPLTELGNRRHYEQTLAKNMARYDREQTPFGLMLLDVDQFKKFNDYYGHSIGDRIIEMVARTLVGHCRPYDTACRWGGDEFAVIIDRADQQVLNTMANRIRNTVARSSLEHNGCHVAVTLSIGMTLAQPTDNVQSISQRADMALATTKQNDHTGVTLN